MQANYTCPQEWDTTQHKFKIHPYQCTECRQVYWRLNAFLAHLRFNKDRCPTPDEITTKLGLVRNEYGYWQVREPARPHITPSGDYKSHNRSSFKKGGRS
jgi:hypothetical protein